MDPLELLAERGAEGFPNLIAARRETSRRLGEMRLEVSTVPCDPGASVVMFGSWGRREYNLTRRLLLLLESVAVLNEPVHRNCRQRVLAGYLDESVKDYRPPRFLLNDIVRYREAVERREKRTLPETAVAARWRDEVFEPTIAAVPDELWARLPAAEVFHQVLEHRWFLSERAGKDVGIEEAVRSYVESELPRNPPERVVLDDG